MKVNTKFCLEIPNLISQKSSVYLNCYEKNIQYVPVFVDCLLNATDNQARHQQFLPVTYFSALMASIPPDSLSNNRHFS